MSTSEVDVAEFARFASLAQRDQMGSSLPGQFFTPGPVGRFMASMFMNMRGDLSVLDPGAGVGSLTAAFCERLTASDSGATRVAFTCVELEQSFIPQLSELVDSCVRRSQRAGLQAEGFIDHSDFLETSANILSSPMVGGERMPYGSFTHVIMNPPYAKMRGISNHRRLLEQLGIRSTNLYSAFLLCAARMLRAEGELVAIVPRSFCNGFYFKAFRHQFFSEVSLRRVHTIGDRNSAFSDDGVLQENVILHAVRSGPRSSVHITSSSSSDFIKDPKSGSMTTGDLTDFVASYGAVVRADADRWVVLPTSELDATVTRILTSNRYSLGDLGIEVSTGPVVPFRVRGRVKPTWNKDCARLLRSADVSQGATDWYVDPDYSASFALSGNLVDLAWPNEGHFVITRRISAKEELRRISARVYKPDSRSRLIAFENHLNVFHVGRRGLPAETALGLCLYLNSALLDRYFRMFSGSTQVNARDLYSLPYPSIEQLRRLGQVAAKTNFTQHAIDLALRRNALTLNSTPDPVLSHRKISEAIEALQALEMPKAQINQRSALTLLALIDLTPSGEWRHLGSPLMGITPILDFVRQNYGISYAPNTRETFRRQTMHQFVQAGLAVLNPDAPGRPVNSPHTCYQITEPARSALERFGTGAWEQSVQAFISAKNALSRRLAMHREIQMVPVQLPRGEELALSPGAHSELIADVISKFAPRFVPDAKVLYVGDTGDRSAHTDEIELTKLGIDLDTRGKLPDLVLFSSSNRWLVLVEAVTSHGPISTLRRLDLDELFTVPGTSNVYVTAFADMRSMARHVRDISWETEVWCADAPDHLIHFDGTKFLGPFTDD